MLKPRLVVSFKIWLMILTCLTLASTSRVGAQSVEPVGTEPRPSLQPGVTLTGLVSSQSGDPLAGVFVEISGPSLPKSRVLVTDTAGQYVLRGLAAGTYQITCHLPSYISVAKSDVQVSQNGTSKVDFTMRTSMTEHIVVTSRNTFTNLADVANPEENLIGIANAASQGAVTAAQIEARPILRPAEVLETVPGLVISQHSGEGKASQYYLRGYNLDHGTDFATTVAGMPVNMPTHAHGQGYSDLNFLIPELVSGVQYRKGPYEAEDGDFSAAGAATINYLNVLPTGIAEVWGGGEGYRRLLFAQSPEIGRGHLLYALEMGQNDGPWVNPDELKKVSGVLRYSQRNDQSAFSLTAMGYDARWNSTDQVPDRALSSGLIPRFGAIDPTDGGSTHRYSLSADWQTTGTKTLTRLAGYLIDYRLNLFSNFTYFLEDPVRGDQFEQADDRVVAGFKGSRSWQTDWFGHFTEATLGLQLRSDIISGAGLYHTQARQRLSTTRQDSVRESSEAFYAETSTQWSTRFRSNLGLRADFLQFHVDSDVEANSGHEGDSLVSPKLGLVMGPFAGTEFYLNAGYGYHSNDARGTTITVDPVTSGPAERVTPLVRTRGGEVGLRSIAIPRLQTTFSIWSLDAESELFFIGDAGTTQAGRPSHRDGIEWATYYSPLPWLTFDANFEHSRATFTDSDPAGSHIPGSLQSVVSAGVAMRSREKAFGSLRLSYFGPRPLVEDNSIRSESSTLVNGQFGYQFGNSLRGLVDVYNLSDAKVSDIDYYYASRLAGEPVQGVEDIHTHPVTPRTFRLALQFSF